MKRLLLIAGIIGAAAAAGIALLRRKRIVEDIDWATVEKPGQLIDIDGYMVHYVERGAGPATMVLVHGFGGHTYSFRKLMPLLSSWRVIAVDLKGYGYSERDANTGLAAADQVAMLRGLLARLGVEHAVILGHSMGGSIARRFAATYPEMVDALVLAATVAGDGRVRMVMPPRVVTRAIAPSIVALVSSRMLDAAYFDAAMPTEDVREEYMRPLRIRGSVDEFVTIMASAGKDEAIDQTRLTMPVLILAGAHDKMIPVEAAQRLREQIPQARLVVIDKAGHMLLEEQPEECARAIEDFLRETSAEKAALPAAT